MIAFGASDFNQQLDLPAKDARAMQTPAAGRRCILPVSRQATSGYAILHLLSGSMRNLALLN